MSIYLNGTLTADGDSAVAAWPGGVGELTVQDDLGGGTATLYFSQDGGTNWDAVGTDTTLSATGGGIFRKGAGSLKVTLASSSSPNAIYEVRRIGRE